MNKLLLLPLLLPVAACVGGEGSIDADDTEDAAAQSTGSGVPIRQWVVTLPGQVR